MCFGHPGKASPDIDTRQRIVAFGLRQGSLGGGDVHNRRETCLVTRLLLLFAIPRSSNLKRSVCSNTGRAIEHLLRLFLLRGEIANGLLVGGLRGQHLRLLLLFLLVDCEDLKCGEGDLCGNGPIEHVWCKPGSIASKVGFELVLVNPAPRPEADP